MKPTSPVTLHESMDELASHPDFPGTPAALVVSHPGHELRVYGWLQLTQPTIFVLSDGSGHSGRSRLSSTTKIAAEAGVRFGRIYGRFTDIGIYNAVLDRDFRVFTSLTDELTRELVEEETAYVVGDAIEGYNPAHDICRMIINAAVELSKRRHGRVIANFDFLLVGNPASGSDVDRAICIRLGRTTHSQKLAAAADYTGLNGDVGDALGSFGADAFQVEYLRPVNSSSLDPGLFDEPPFYEQYGERQVSRGYYDRVLRYREHMVPLSEALNSYVEHDS